MEAAGRQRRSRDWSPREALNASSMTGASATAALAAADHHSCLPPHPAHALRPRPQPFSHWLGVLHSMTATAHLPITHLPVVPLFTCFGPFALHPHHGPRRTTRPPGVVWSTL